MVVGSSATQPNIRKRYSVLGLISSSVDTDIIDGLVYPPTQAKSYSFSETDVPYAGADQSYFTGMNNSNVFFGSTTNATVANATTFEPDYMTFGTIYKNGAFTGATLTYPGDPNVILTQPFAINNNGVVVGWYFTFTDGLFHGFTYNTSTGEYNNIDYPGSTSIMPTGINDAGWIVGTVEVDGSFNVISGRVLISRYGLRHGVRLPTVGELVETAT